MSHGARSEEPADPRQRVLGTAGHIDHGKTTLIAALTGTDTDRLPEEKARGITIELGFAALELDTGERLSVVDVPGHEKLVRTMVSGATGIDVVLLVVAADEGVMPQTREHVAICDLLGLERGVVALTKTDLVDDEMCELASEEARDLLATTSLAGAEVVPVSAVSGDGLAELRAALARALHDTEAHTPRTGPPRLAIDRVFTMKGFGAVATGTLVGDALEVGGAVEIQPEGLRARIRGLQSHGVTSERVAPGTRCAVNLHGVETAALSRGEVITAPGALAPTHTADVALRWLVDAPELGERASVEVLTGTAHRRARLAPIGGRALKAGEEGFARMHIEGPALPVLPGDRFVVRGFARIAGFGGTLGGGIVLDVAPPRRSRRDAELQRELALFRAGDATAAVRERVRRRGLAGVSLETLERETGLRGEALEPIVTDLEQTGELHRARARNAAWLVASDAAERLERDLLAALDAYHTAEPLRPGMPRGALLGSLPDNVPSEVAELALARLQQRGALAVEEDLARRPEHRPTLDPDAHAAVERIVAESRAAGLEPPAPREWADALGLELARLRDLLAHLEREGALVRAPGDLWFDAHAISELRKRVVDHLQQHGELSTVAYKSLIGTSRRTAIPLMELFDELHVTRRVGDARVLRSG